MASQGLYTLGDLERLTGATRSQLTAWTRSGLLQPSLQGAKGTGTRQLFNWSDLCTCFLLRSLYECGVKSVAMRSILNSLRDFSWPEPPPEKSVSKDLFLLVESVPLGRIYLVRATSFDKAVEKKPRVLGVNVSALQRVLWKRLQEERSN
jgi:hypothetical protein